MTQRLPQRNVAAETMLGLIHTLAAGERLRVQLVRTSFCIRRPHSSIQRDTEDMQSPAALRRRRIALGLFIAALLSMAGPLVLSLFALDVAGLPGPTGLLPALLASAALAVWYRADRVFDRDFDPDDQDDQDDQDEDATDSSR